MSRLFWTVYAKIVIAIALAALAAALFILPRVDARGRENVVETMAGPIGVLAAVLADEHRQGHDLDAAFARLAAPFKTPCALQRRADVELDAGGKARLAQGELVPHGRFMGLLLFVPVEGTDRVLRVGPLLSRHPLGEGRFPAIVVLLVAGLLFGVHVVLRPIRRRLHALSGAAAALGAGDLQARVDVRGRDELSRVGAAFNHMASEVERHIAAQRELLHMVSHELRTPLQRIQFNTEQLHMATDDAVRAPALARIDRDVEELDDLLSELLTFVRLGDRKNPQRATVDVCALLEDLCTTMASDTITLAFLRPAPQLASSSASLDERLVRRAVSNLVSNALSFARTRVEVSFEHAATALHVHVDDDGPGIADDARDRVFEPFHSGDPDRGNGQKHFGLGLAIVRRVATLHGGHAEATSSPLGGARLRLVLPHA